MLNQKAVVSCLALLLAPSMAQAGTLKDYRVSLKIRSGTELVGQPVIQARAQQPATIELAGGYRIQVMVTPDGAKPGNVLLTSDITITSSDMQRNQKSTVSLRPRQAMAFDFAPPANAPAVAPVRVEISAVAVAD